MVAKVGADDLDKSTTLESNKSLHKDNVCPDGAPGSRATSFWSQTTTTLSGGAAKGPR